MHHSGEHGWLLLAVKPLLSAGGPDTQVMMIELKLRRTFFLLGFTSRAALGMLVPGGCFST